MVMDAAIGTRLLGQIEEASLEQILTTFRASYASSPPTRLKLTHLTSVDDIAVRHLRDTQSSTISISGRHLPLVYKIVATLISPPHSHTLLILDLDGRFDATSLDCSDNDLPHVYVQRPAFSNPGHLRALVAAADSFMLYDDATRISRSRVWWGTVVVGGLAAGDLVAGWKGWLRVDRNEVPSFGVAMGVEEAWERREERQRAVDEAGWMASSQWGGFVFHDGRAG